MIGPLLRHWLQYRTHGDRRQGKRRELAYLRLRDFWTLSTSGGPVGPSCGALLCGVWPIASSLGWARLAQLSCATGPTALTD